MPREEIREASTQLADLTVSEWLGTSYPIEIHFAVFNRLIFYFNFLHKTC